MLLIKNAHVYAPEDMGIQDILIAGGCIAEIDTHIEAAPYMEIVD